MIHETIYKPRDKTNMNLNKYKRHHDFKGNNFLIRVYEQIKNEEQ